MGRFGALAVWRSGDLAIWRSGGPAICPSCSQAVSLSCGDIGSAMPAHASIAQDAPVAVQADQMRRGNRLAGVGRPVGNGEQKRSGKRRADQAGQYRPAKSLAPPADCQYAHHQGQHYPEQDEQEHGAIVNRLTPPDFYPDAQRRLRQCAPTRVICFAGRAARA